MRVVGDASPLMFPAKIRRRELIVNLQLISPHDVKTLLDQLIESHAFRIGIGVYQAVLRAIPGAS